MCLIIDCVVPLQGLKPSFTFSVGEPGLVKDISWRKKSENSYLVLSDYGKLYRGTVDGSIKDVMDNVDAGTFYLFSYFGNDMKLLFFIVLFIVFKMKQ